MALIRTTQRFRLYQGIGRVYDGINNLYFKHRGAGRILCGK
jgi:hypothetical protein